MQESNKVESAVQVQNEVKQDEFRVGDVVWDTAYGKGKVVFLDDDAQPVKVVYDSGDHNWYAQNGKMSFEMNRTLFFSEPKIEASVTRPFVPTLVGKRVVVRDFDETWTRHPVVITAETEEEIFTKNGSDYKCNIVEIYEVSSENLLTSKK